MPLLQMSTTTPKVVMFNMEIGDEPSEEESADTEVDHNKLEEQVKELGQAIAGKFPNGSSKNDLTPNFLFFDPLFPHAPLLSLKNHQISSFFKKTPVSGGIISGWSLMQRLSFLVAVLSSLKYYLIIFICMSSPGRVIISNVVMFLSVSGLLI